MRSRDRDNRRDLIARWGWKAFLNEWTRNRLQRAILRRHLASQRKIFMRIPGRITHELDRVPFETRVLIPNELLAGLHRYLEDGIRPGSFLCSVLSNDLKGAIKRASPGSRMALPALVEVLLGYVPANAWGSEEALEAWLREEAGT